MIDGNKEQSTFIENATVYAQILMGTAGMVISAPRLHRDLENDLEAALGRPLDDVDKTQGKTKAIWRPLRMGALNIAAVELAELGIRGLDRRLIGERLPFATMFYNLGSAQDDSIDAYQLTQEDTVETYKRKVLRQPEVIGAYWKVFEEKIISSSLYSDNEKELILSQVRGYFDMVCEQEFENKQKDPMEFDYDYTFNYRMQQNRMAAQTMLRVIAGDKVPPDQIEQLGDSLGSLTLLTQLTDDLSDLAQDWNGEGGTKPSLLIGAITSVGELENIPQIIQLISEGKLPKKLSLTEIMQYLPDTYGFIQDKINEHLQRVRTEYKHGAVYAPMQETVWKHYLKIRNLLYKIFGEKAVAVLSF